MVKDAVFRDTELIKIQILNILVNLPNHSILDKDIIKQTGVSQFRLQNLIEELDTEINQHIVDPDVSFKYENNYLTTQNLTCSHIKIIRLEYIVNSNSFKIMRYNQFENNRYKLHDFLEDNGIGQPNYYHLRKELEPLLERKTVFAMVPTYIDNFEYVKRRKLASLFYSYYTDVWDPFPEVSETVTEFINLIASKMPFDLSHANTAKLRICISVQLMRIKNKNFLKNYSVPMTLKTEELANEFSLIYKQFAQDDDVDALTEAVFLLSICYSQIVVKDPAKYGQFVEFDSYIQKKNHSLYTFLDKLLEINASDHGFSPAEIDQKIGYILRLNEWLLIFDLGFINGVPDSVYQSLVAKYPQRSLVSDQYVDKLITTFDLDLEEQSLNYLKYNYLIGFMEIIPDDSVDKNVNIALDYANSFAYADYVKMLLRRYPSIHIDDCLSDHTDIYMTDVYSDFVKIPQVVWPNLPDKKELIAFEKIVQNTQFNKIKLAD